MDTIQAGTVVGLLAVIPAGFAAWGWAVGVAAAVVLAFGVPWLIDIHAGQWIFGVMRSGVILAAVGALSGVRRRAANSA